MIITYVSSSVSSPFPVTVNQSSPTSIRIVANSGVSTSVRVTYSVVANVSNTIWKYRMANSDQSQKLFLHHTIGRTL